MGLLTKILWYLFASNPPSSYKKRYSTSRVKTKKESVQKYKQGRFTPRNPEKYDGDINEIIYRSGWEKTAFDWCDMNYRISSWASEEVEVPYFMKGVPYERTYFPDLWVEFSNGETVLVEIKPNKEKIDPSYENKCKWASARAYCRDYGWSFQIWDEGTINKLQKKVEYWQRMLRKK